MSLIVNLTIKVIDYKGLEPNLWTTLRKYNLQSIAFSSANNALLRVNDFVILLHAITSIQIM